MSSGLDQCACKRGFYTLRDCGNAATATCSMCSRRICDEHRAPGADPAVCVECAAKQEEGDVMQALGGQQVGWWQRAGLGAAVLRQRQYRTRSYRPRYWGSYDPYYQYYNFLWYDDDDGDDDGFDDS